MIVARPKISQLAATASVGAVTTGQGTTVSVTGLVATASVGSVTTTNITNVHVTGVFATGETSGVQVWMEIVPSQTPNWVEIAA